MASDDRVYQGMTIAFDFSVEEIWVPWLSGATLVPKPGRINLLGGELDRFLAEREVTALCCVPTLLSTLDGDRSGLRFLLVSGESCPPDLVSRWSRDGRRFLNVYGPTEATVTATWTVLHPGRPVTIGVPLPTYSAVILDPDADRTLPPGEMGEIGLAGIGLASGYLNRPELTERAFIPDFLGIPDNPAGRIYRTGDLGRINTGGEIEHHGRIDTQVKIRGYRVELTEIESALLGLDGIGQAAVDVWHPEPDVTELAAYYSPGGGVPAPDADRITNT
jgi:non-ribosomal peptide synthetase component F